MTRDDQIRLMQKARDTEMAVLELMQQCQPHNVAAGLDQALDIVRGSYILITSTLADDVPRPPRPAR